MFWLLIKSVYISKWIKCKSQSPFLFFFTIAYASSSKPLHPSIPPSAHPPGPEQLLGGGLQQILHPWPGTQPVSQIMPAKHSHIHTTEAQKQCLMLCLQQSLTVLACMRLPSFFIRPPTILYCICPVCWHYTNWLRNKQHYEFIPPLPPPLLTRHPFCSNWLRLCAFHWLSKHLE